MPSIDKKRAKGASQTGGNPKIVIKGKKTYSSRYGSGLADEGKIVMKKKPNFSSRYK